MCFSPGYFFFWQKYLDMKNNHGRDTFSFIHRVRVNLTIISNSTSPVVAHFVSTLMDTDSASPTRIAGHLKDTFNRFQEMTGTFLELLATLGTFPDTGRPIQPGIPTTSCGTASAPATPTTRRSTSYVFRSHAH